MIETGLNGVSWRNHRAAGPQGHAAAPQAPGAQRRNSAEDEGAQAPSLLSRIRAGLADPFAQQIVVPAGVLSRAEARAIERALSGADRPRVRRFAIVWRGVSS